MSNPCMLVAVKKFQTISLISVSQNQFSENILSRNVCKDSTYISPMNNIKVTMPYSQDIFKHINYTSRCHLLGRYRHEWVKQTSSIDGAPDCWWLLPKKNVYSHKTACVVTSETTLSDIIMSLLGYHRTNLNC